jgi:hypothetical protein
MFFKKFFTALSAVFFAFSSFGAFGFSANSEGGDDFEIPPSGYLPPPMAISLGSSPKRVMKGDTVVVSVGLANHFMVAQYDFKMLEFGIDFDSDQLSFEGFALLPEFDEWTDLVEIEEISPGVVWINVYSETEGYKGNKDTFIYISFTIIGDSDWIAVRAPSKIAPPKSIPDFGHDIGGTSIRISPVPFETETTSESTTSSDTTVSETTASETKNADNNVNTGVQTPFSLAVLCVAGAGTVLTLKKKTK